METSVLTALLALGLNGGGIIYLGRLYRDEKDKRIAEWRERYDVRVADLQEQIKGERARCASYKEERDEWRKEAWKLATTTHQATSIAEAAISRGGSS